MRIFKTAKRVYKLASLEAWFGYLLSIDWESSFSHEELTQGRELYRQSCVHEVELSGQDAIIHAKFSENSAYVIIEFLNGSLSVRSSLSSTLAGRALAVAGLYEIEELLADEISSLSGEIENPGDSKLAAGESEKTVPLQEEVKDSGFKLFLEFKSDVEGLICSPHVLLKDGTLRRIAKSYLEQPHFREQWIRFTGLARKIGFRPRGSVFLLREIHVIRRFLGYHISKWKKWFTVKEDVSILSLRKPPQAVKVVLHAEEKFGELKLSWRGVMTSGGSADDSLLLDLLNSRKGMCIVPGQGVFSVSAEVQKLYRLWTELKETYIADQGLPKYLLFSLFADASELSLALSSDLQKWEENLRAKPQVPGGLLPMLRSYQQEGVAWLLHHFKLGCHALLADEMGLGKTLQVLSVIDQLWASRSQFLVVCPASVLPVWRHEIQAHFPHLYHETVGKDVLFKQNNQPTIWLCSYTQLRRNRSYLKNVTFKLAVLDEAQVVKNPDAKVSQSCFSIKAKHRLAMTGTPVENRHLDLWSIFRFLMPGLLGSRQEFEYQCELNPQVVNEKIKQQLSPFVLRRTKKEVALDLPDKIECDLYCSLTSSQKKHYEKIATEGVSSLGDAFGVTASPRSTHLFTLLTRLRQASCDPSLLPGINSSWEHSGKLQALKEKVEELQANGQKAVIFSQFVQLLDRAQLMLRECYPDLAQYRLTGATHDRSRPVESFQKSEGPALIFVSLKAGGTGITLHSAQYVFLLDPWWNPAVEAQAIDRIHRIGQKKTTFVYRLVASGTLEERIQQLKEKKRELFTDLIEDLQGFSALETAFDSLEDLILLSENSSD